MKVMLEPGAVMPTRAHATDAGLDLYAREGQTVRAGGSAVLDTGVHIQYWEDEKWKLNATINICQKERPC